MNHYLTQYSLQIRLPPKVLTQEAVDFLRYAGYAILNQAAAKQLETAIQRANELTGPFQIIEALRRTSPSAERALRQDGKTGTPVGWYTWETDICSFSRHYPLVLFVMEGRGEDRNDVWKAFVMNGKIHVEVGMIRYDRGFDPEKLR